MKVLAKSIAFIVRMALLMVMVGMVTLVAFVTVKGNQPMRIRQVPAGMTYREFIQDRLAAAKEVQPQRCGVGRLVTYVALAPAYSVVYTQIGLNPGGLLDRVSQSDPNIPVGVQDTPWYEVPDLWWGVFERISWSMLGRHTSACNFRAVARGN